MAWRFKLSIRVIASHNGLEATRRAFESASAGVELIDAIVSGVTLVEDDPSELTVGYGGLPNEDGIVELDAAVMDGATHRAGAVAGLQGIRHPSQVALRVMRHTKRVLLVGEGALQFAKAEGFSVEDLLTPRSREMWLYWKRRRSTIDDWISPAEDDVDLDVQRWFERHFFATQPAAPLQPNESGIRAERTGTVHVAGQDSHGNFAACTSTSGHAFKLAGRVGDSPIIGAGLYVDNRVGTCGSIGHGEANLENCTSFACVELMRQGKTAAEATREVLERVVERSRPHERDAFGRPNFELMVFALGRDGDYAGASLWNERWIAITDEAGSRREPCSPLFIRERR